MILAIDPAASFARVGWAEIAANGILFKCGVGEPPPWSGEHVIIEKPQIYRASKSEGDPNDLIDVAVMVGQMRERYASPRSACGKALGAPRVMLVKPAQWKGQVPKKIHCARIEKALNQDERFLTDAITTSLRHNMLDAVGLGKWYWRFLKAAAYCGGNPGL